jgi:hypothetical protein
MGNIGLAQTNVDRRADASFPRIFLLPYFPSPIGFARIYSHTIEDSKSEFRKFQKKTKNNFFVKIVTKVYKLYSVRVDEKRHGGTGNPQLNLEYHHIDSYHIDS